VQLFWSELITPRECRVSRFLGNVPRQLLCPAP
jgi:hypothetical protein